MGNSLQFSRHFFSFEDFLGARWRSARPYVLQQQNACRVGALRMYVDEIYRAAIDLHDVYLGTATTNRE